MASRREHDRIKSESPCFLVDDDGDIFDALLEDISQGGALIMVDGGVPQSISVGDACNLMLRYDTTHSRPCRVVWSDSINMGISFLTDREQ